MLTTAIVGLIALLSTAALAALWFWVVRRELYAKQKAVKSALRQLNAGKQQSIRERDGPAETEAKKILERSLDVYIQSVTLYNNALKKPWYGIPAMFLGFHTMGKENRI